MQKKITNQFLVFICSFIIGTLITKPSHPIFQFFDLKYWSIMIILFMYVFTYGLLKLFKEQLKSNIILLWTIVGSIIFLLPYSFNYFPERLFLLDYVLSFIIGIVLAFIVLSGLSKKQKLISLIIVVLYSICNILFIYDWFASISVA